MMKQMKNFLYNIKDQCVSQQRPFDDIRKEIKIKGERCREHELPYGKRGRLALNR